MKHWETLLFNGETAAKLSQNARQYVHAHYSAKRMANEYVDLFSTLITD